MNAGIIIAIIIALVVTFLAAISLVFFLIIFLKCILPKFKSSNEVVYQRQGYAREERQSLLSEKRGRDYSSSTSSYSSGANYGHTRELTSEEILGAKMALRSTRFTFSKEVGRTPGKGDKLWFFCTEPGNQKNEFLMSIFERHTRSYTTPRKTMIQTEDEKVAFIRMMKNLSSPYIMPIRDCNFITTTQRCVIIRDFVKNGSLKDLIHGVNSPMGLNYQQKYLVDGVIPGGSKKQLPLKEGARPLKKHMCSLFGRQILLGLISLKKIGLRFPQLSTTNVLVLNRESCVLTEMENIFLDMPRAYSSFITPQNRRIPEEILAFAHVLFEMATGACLEDKPFPDVLTQYNIWPGLEDVLKMILSPTSASHPPTLEDLLAHEFFTVNSNFETNPAPALPKLSPNMEQLLTKVNAFVQDPVLRTASRTMSASREIYSKNVSDSFSKSWGSFKGSHFEKKDSDDIFKVTPQKPQENMSQTSPVPIQQQIIQKPTSAPTSPPPPLPPSVPSGPAPTSDGRKSALFDEIRRGAQLRKVPETEKRHRDSARR